MYLNHKKFRGIYFSGDHMTKAKKYLFPSSLIFLFLSLLLFPGEASAGIGRGIKSCCGVLAPSLFPFIFLSEAIFLSGSDRLLAPLLSPLARALDLPPECGIAVALSLTGGFPVGAGCVRSLYSQKRINLSQAQRMMCFCVCPGPAFMITAVGVIILGDQTLGIILYASQIISSLVIAILLSVFSRTGRDRNNMDNIKDGTAPKKAPAPCKSPLGAFLSASAKSAASMIRLSALVIIFSMLLSIMDASGISGGIAGLFHLTGIDTRTSGLLLPAASEVTAGCNAVRTAGLPLWYFSLAAGFGGMCVHMQIFDILREIPIKKGRYLLFRLFNSVFAAAVTRAICVFYNGSRTVFAVPGGAEAEISSVTYSGGAALLICCIIFVMSLKEEKYVRNSRLV